MSETLAEPIPTIAQPAETFEALYRRAFPRVYAYVASLLRDRAAAEDVTSLAFERAYRRRRGYKRSRGTPEAWLFGIARNAALDELRRRRRRASLDADVADVWSHTPDEHAELALRRSVVRAALGRLDARERELVALKYAGGLTNAEIARVVGISESNAGTKLHRTLEKLRRECHDDA
ncbi:MAG: sigma-70 family RNA polymerase sigma factor [Thermoleophilaceae bacterium]